MATNKPPAKRTKAACRRAHISAGEARLYADLAAMLHHAEPMKLIWYIINAQILSDGRYRVPSFGKDAAHITDVENNRCSSCKGFDVHGNCSHLTAMRFRSTIQFKRIQSERRSTGYDEPEIRFDPNDPNNVPF